MNYEVGDFIQLKKIKRKLRLPTDTKFEIERIDPLDKTVLITTYDGMRYGVFAENIKQVFPRKEVVAFT